MQETTSGRTNQCQSFGQMENQPVNLLMQIQGWKEAHTRRTNMDKMKSKW